MILFIPDKGSLFLLCNDILRAWELNHVDNGEYKILDLIIARPVKLI
jgi:hypothetical protein